MKWIVGQGDNVIVEKEIYIATTNGQYIIWGTLEKSIDIDEETGDDIWGKYSE